MGGCLWFFCIMLVVVVFFLAHLGRRGLCDLIKQCSCWDEVIFLIPVALCSPGKEVSESSQALLDHSKGFSVQMEAYAAFMPLK